jgi:hypothetical protein
MFGIRRFTSLPQALRAGFEVLDPRYVDSEGALCILLRTRTSKGYAMAICYLEAA